jgi:hypothetical protein
MSYTGNLTRADEQELDVAHPDYVPLAERRDQWRAAQRAAQADVISWAKLPDGSWGIRGLNLVAGDVVTVTKRTGETSEVTVGEVTPKNARSAYDFATVARTPRVTAEVTVEVTVPASAAPDVPSGRYAVYNDDQSVNDIAFYKVDNVTEGKWEGFTFVKQIVGPDEQKVGQKQGNAILAKIAAMGVVESFQLYGRTIEKCGVCNIRLTNKESREYGIGPDCRAKHGY